jgi:hypothetical protein
VGELGEGPVLGAGHVHDIPAITGEITEALPVKWQRGVGDVVDVARRDPCTLQAVFERSGRKPRLVLDAAEPLLGGRGDQLAIHDNAYRALVGDGGKTEDDHARIEPGTEP